MSIARDDPFRDLTQSESGQHRLAAAHRYTQVGMCVSSVTHDINNHLGAIMAYAELLGMDHTDPETARMVEEIVEAVKRSSQLIEDLTAVARKERPEMSRCMSLDIARRALDLRMYDLKMAKVKVEKCLPGEERLLTCDRPFLEQAILYLISNSLEALEGTESPVLRFTLAHDDGHAHFTVWDSGPGIPEDLREACFEPLVTTKGPPHMGLGLFTARRVVAKHRGTLTYSPENGMCLSLPLGDEDLKDLA
jgi:two-component system NtrC family sensor kinase